MSAPACAARLGHSRIVSAPGQPLKIDVPLVGLDAVEQATLRVWLAEPDAWRQAGLNPPVSLDSMHVRVTYGSGRRSRLIEISSNQIFDGSVADLLLGVSSAEGEQRYQISILSDARGAGAPVLAAGPRLGSQTHGVTTHHAQAIRVRRGDTMFAIARRHAVPGVTVYQMMIALQRANPRAFIRHNLNLVKAGAALAMPDRAALTAVSDREARRLFMQQVREFNAYRQRLAGESTPPVVGASAAAGRVSQEAQAPKPAPVTPQDRVVLSSGASSTDRAADQKASTGKAVADSRQRITELEQNIHHLNQALQGSGSGASGAGTAATANGSAPSSASNASGAGTGGGSSAGGVTAPMLANAARGTASSSGAAGSSDSTGHGASNADVGTVTSAGVVGGSAASGGQGTPQTATTKMAAAGHPEGAGGVAPSHSGNAAVAQSATQAGHTTIAQSSAAEAGGSVSGSTEGIMAGSSGSAASHGTAGTADVNASGASGGGTGSQAGEVPGKTNPAGKAAASGASGAVTAGNSTSSSEASSAPSAPSAPNEASTGGASNTHAAGAGESAASNKSGKNVSWIQEHMLGVVTALLALIVLIIAWVLRRINTVRDDGGNGPRITEAMVQEKLDQINLDLRQSSGDGPAPAKD
ncbi:MAG TPA: FimV/HubP family polar landmark protein [Burkholderiaceae bacterium]|nr:FimV/HubP family polar landmark protein [Burkholderiaceae bacterium]